MIYSGDSATPQQILEKANNRFSIDLRRYLDSGEICFVFLRYRVWVEASSWPRFTMIGQSLGSIMLGLEALWKYIPDIYVDSMGYAFTFPVFRYFGGCTVACYVHYPTISTDMLSKVTSSEASFNNSAEVAGSSWRTSAKLWYYQYFAILYSLVGNRADLVITNSSWTRGHIAHIWGLPPSSVHLVFPACDTSRLQKLPLQGRERLVVSLGQFRPEKNHPLQLESFLALRKAHPELKGVKLAMVGGTRVGNEGDQRIVDNLRAKIESDPLLRDCAAVHVSMSHLVVRNVERSISCFPVESLDVSNDDLKAMLSRASVGLHTMSHEHFGIGIVELMAAGVVPVAHNSGGPKQDIVVPFDDQTTGFLATTPEEYADSMSHILINTDETARMQIAGRKSANRFSDEAFSSKIVSIFKLLPQVARTLA